MASRAEGRLRGLHGCSHTNEDHGGRALRFFPTTPPRRASARACCCRIPARRAFGPSLCRRGELARPNANGVQSSACWAVDINLD